MVAAPNGELRDSTAARSPIALRIDVFDRLMAGLGADNDVARARVLGIDRATISRMRTRRFAPRLELAMRMATVLGTTVDELFELVP
jgi:plasmid maintenance system antidote protein VapI